MDETITSIMISLGVLSGCIVVLACLIVGLTKRVSRITRRDALAARHGDVGKRSL